MAKWHIKKGKLIFLRMSLQSMILSSNNFMNVGIFLSVFSVALECWEWLSLDVQCTSLEIHKIHILAIIKIQLFTSQDTRSCTRWKTLNFLDYWRKIKSTRLMFLSHLKISFEIQQLWNVRPFSEWLIVVFVQINERICSQIYWFRCENDQSYGFIIADWMKNVQSRLRPMKASKATEDERWENR